jgi:hypothetical protein
MEPTNCSAPADKGKAQVSRLAIVPHRPTFAQRLCQLFRGNERVHGRLNVNNLKRDPKTGKVQGHQRTVPGPATPELWEQYMQAARASGPIRYVMTG